MRISYDRTVDTLRFILHDATVTAQELEDGVVAEYDAAGRFVGIQISDALRRIGDLSALRHVILDGLGPPVAQGQPPSTIVASHIVLDETCPTTMIIERNLMRRSSVRPKK